MGLKGGDCGRKAELKIKQYENPLRAPYANQETCQIPTCLSHEFHNRIKNRVWDRVSV